MEIYLDANATTPVHPRARAAALDAMAGAYGNPSSAHASGRVARSMLDTVRARARRVLGAGDADRLVFGSGATEALQTAVLSALVELRARRDAGTARPGALLYGATEHKAVPEALHHWNRLLGLDLPVRAIPVGPDGRHDLAWLRAEAPRAGLVCTMAANNETGVVSDLDGIAAALAGSPARWLVDAVQAFGKLPLGFHARRIDYAAISGHKFYAPKGVGLLVVREGAPYTPLLTGGGQEGAARAGTENTAGIAAFGAVLAALEEGDVFASPAELAAHRGRLVAALGAAFPGIVFHAPAGICLPTTLNFSVPGLAPGRLIALFDAAGLRVSGGSACGSARAEPSPVLRAMGRSDAEARGAVRLSFGAADDAALIDAACARIGDCGRALRAEGAEAVVDADRAAGVAGAMDAAPALRATDAASANGANRAADPNGAADTNGASAAAGPAPAVPAVDDDPDPAAVAACSVSGPALDALLRADPPPLVVDVRDLAEQRLAPARVPGARGPVRPVPLVQLLADAPDWAATAAPLLLVCHSGRRSARAAVVLRRLGHPDAWSLDGGLATIADAAVTV